MKLGVTGSRLGATPAQLAAFKELMLMYEVTEFHHGDCRGVDAMTAQIVGRMAIYGQKIIHCHPPSNPKYRAFFGGGTIYPEKAYMIRNQEIVNCSEALVVIPRTSAETIRSGTWATFRMARAAGIPCFVIGPVGTMRTEL